MDRLTFPACLLIALLARLAVADEPPRTRQGTVDYTPADNEDIVPEAYRLEPHSFRYEQEVSAASTAKLELSRVTFPSPVETPVEINNTVHCEYQRPTGLAAGERVPAVVVLHILGGDFALSRAFCYHLGGRKVATLFVKMPYYGPRRDPKSRARMVSDDPHETARGMKQAVLDIRRARAWLASQPEVEPEQTGIMGISLGGIVGALSAECEPRFSSAALLLAGGDVNAIAWESDKLRKLRQKWQAQGGTRESLKQVLAPVDPVTYGANLRGRRVLMLNASQDEIIPRAATESLWRSIGQPEIVWMDAGHITAARYMFDALNRVGNFFAEPPSAGAVNAVKVVE